MKITLLSLLVSAGSAGKTFAQLAQTLSTDPKVPSKPIYVPCALPRTYVQRCSAECRSHPRLQLLQYALDLRKRCKLGQNSLPERNRRFGPGSDFSTLTRMRPTKTDLVELAVDAFITMGVQTHCQMVNKPE